ncbi:sterol-binding protein [Lewinellaceae bacterium SD302]|nr:sterol-binding protein [Lewinellaceae bacterium SD302]
MTLEEFTAKVSQAAASAPQMGKSIKLQLEEGIVHIDMTEEQAVVTNEDKEANTTIITSIGTLDKLRKGELNPMMAMMTKKIQIKGDMGLAMKLQSLLS